MILQAIAWVPAAGLALLLVLLELRVGRAPRLQPVSAQPAASRSASSGSAASALASEPGLFLRVVIPAYNEADNIAACIAAVLASDEPGIPWQLLVIDDGSTDATAELARAAIAGCDHAQLLEAGPRPVGERWVGKNWAASRAAAHPWPEGSPERQWLLFIDADVRLKPHCKVSNPVMDAVHSTIEFCLFGIKKSFDR